MKYFETHLTVGIAADGTLPDVDISVHCDARVFEWLVNYISETEPRPRISEHDLSHDGVDQLLELPFNQPPMSR